MGSGAWLHGLLLPALGAAVLLLVQVGGGGQGLCGAFVRGGQSLLEKAFAEVSKRPDLEQDALATMILQELAPERRWENALADSADVLAQLADEAPAERREDWTQVLELDRLLNPALRSVSATHSSDG